MWKLSNFRDFAGATYWSCLPKAHLYFGNSCLFRVIRSSETLSLREIDTLEFSLWWVFLWYWCCLFELVLLVFKRDRCHTWKCACTCVLTMSRWAAIGFELFISEVVWVWPSVKLLLKSHDPSLSTLKLEALELFLSIDLRLRFLVKVDDFGIVAVNHGNEPFSGVLHLELRSSSSGGTHTGAVRGGSMSLENSISVLGVFSLFSFLSFCLLSLENCCSNLLFSLMLSPGWDVSENFFRTRTWRSRGPILWLRALYHFTWTIY